MNTDNKYRVLGSTVEQVQVPLLSSFQCCAATGIDSEQLQTENERTTTTTTTTATTTAPSHAPFAEVGVDVVVVHVVVAGVVDAHAGKTVPEEVARRVVVSRPVVVVD
jgi:hypothetical protein